MSTPVDLSNREELIRAASTSLNSKVVSQHASLLAPLAVDAVMTISNNGTTAADLRNIRVVKKHAGTIDDTKLINGLLLNQGAETGANGPTRVEKAKIAIIQFQLSPPKTDVENNVIVQDYAAMDRILKEERSYLLQLIKKIKVRYSSRNRPHHSQGKAEKDETERKDFAQASRVRIGVHSLSAFFRALRIAERKCGHRLSEKRLCC